MSKTYAVDFDGTLCNNIYPQIGHAKQEVIDKLIKLKDQGDKLILWTCRTGKTLDEALEWCTSKGLVFDAVNENLEEIANGFEEDSRKILVDYYLDDKSLTINQFLEENVSNTAKEVTKVSKKFKDNLKDFLQVKNATDTTADLYFYGDIVSDWWGAWQDEDQYPDSIKNFLNDHKDKSLNIHVNSGGGSVFAGITIYNMLKNHKGYKTVYVDGVAASIASVIALVGDKVVMGTGTTFMIHKPLTRITGNAYEMRECADWLDKIQECIMQVYKENLRNESDYEVIESMVNAETWLNAEETAKYFAVECSTSLEAIACNSDYFERYERTPKALKEKQKTEIQNQADEEKENINMTIYI